MAGVVAAVVVLVGYGVHTLRTRTARWTLSSHSLAQIAVANPPGRCVVTDDVSILLLSGRFSADDPGCPPGADSFPRDPAPPNAQAGHSGGVGPSNGHGWPGWSGPTL